MVFFVFTYFSNFVCLLKKLASHNNKKQHKYKWVGLKGPSP